MIVVVGLNFEARIAAGPGIAVLCGGTGGTLAALLERAIDKGTRGLLSFGVAGGLDPMLRPGACIVASEVLAGSERIPCDAGWVSKLLAAMPEAVHGSVVGVPAPVACPRRKATLHADTGAVGVDMESHVVARYAAVHGLPFAVLRAVTDPAERALPGSVLAGMRANGTSDPFGVFKALLRRPGELPAVLRTARDAWAARNTLIRGRDKLGMQMSLLTNDPGPRVTARHSAASPLEGALQP
ncbi:MAG TPA: phosphorylase [Xanthobacteraceae bacterium]|jgi:hopanoid-associated phosphorylase